MWASVGSLLVPSLENVKDRSERMCTLPPASHSTLFPVPHPWTVTQPHTAQVPTSWGCHSYYRPQISAIMTMCPLEKSEGCGESHWWAQFAQRPGLSIASQEQTAREIVGSFLGSGCVTGLDIQKEVQRKTMGMCSVVGEEVWAGPQISRGFCSRKRHCLRRYLPWKLRAEPPWETQTQGKQLKEQS